MAKRFTDSEKWKRDWYTDLPVEAKAAWTYLTDNCDHAGIWPRNLSLMSFLLKAEVTQQKLEQWFGDKIILIDEDKYLIPSFIKFQYGKTLKRNNNVHLSVIKIIDNLGAWQHLRSTSPGSKEQDKNKDMDKNKEKEGGQGETLPFDDEVQNGLAELDLKIKTRKGIR